MIMIFLVNGTGINTREFKQEVKNKTKKMTTQKQPTATVN